MGSEIRQYNDWFDHVSRLSEKERKKWVEGVILDLRNQAKEQKNKKIARLADMLEDKSQCKVIGFHPFIEYSRVFGHKEMLEPNFLHAWGGVVLVCAMKGLPAVMLIGADIEWNDDEGFKG
jgi:hypothetical protein